MRLTYLLGAGLMLCLNSPLARALDYAWGDIALSGKTFVTVGAGIRLEDRDESLLYKLNIQGQQDLCQADDCLSLTGDPAPNQRLVNARGDFSAHLFDDGNLNYDKGDLYTALIKVNSDWTATWKEWFFKVNVVGFFDHINTGFSEVHPNSLLRPASTRRNNEVEKRAGKQIELRAWQAASSFVAFDQEFFFAIGRQRMRWGESNLTLLNTLDVINPLDASLARQPGFPIKEAFNPVELITLGTDISESISLEGFYQFKWRGVQAEPSGTMFSSFDPIAGGEYATLTLGQFPEDPEARYVSQGILGLFSNSHRTLFLPDDDAMAPPDGGQYGLNMRLYLPDFNDGTALAFYFANYHSRLPYFSMNAAQESCGRDSANLLQALNDCNGFNAGRHPETAERCDPRGCNMQAYLAREIMPVDTASAFLEYPEDLKMFGVSFNTTVGGWSLSGEYAYRPELPLQVLISDVFFAGIQPGLPSNAFSLLELSTLDPIALLNLITNPAAGQRTLTLLADLAAEGYLTPETLNLSIPSSRQVAPDFINHQFRGITAGPGDYVRGYEQFKAHQIAVNTLKVFARNPFGADSVIFVLEAGATYIQDMPGPEDGLFLQGRQNFTHPSVGADGSGLAPGQSPGFTFNPTQQTEGFADDFAWGLRSLIQLEYPNVWNSGINAKPTLVSFWDIEGIAPFPVQNYVEGNLWLIPGVFFDYGEDFSASILYQHFAGENNQLRDRDSLAVEVTYSF